VILAELKHKAPLIGSAGDNILSHQIDDDRLFLQVDILGHKISSLLDSGASKCVIGGPGFHLISDLNLPKYDCDIKRVELADKSCNEVLGQVDLPITLGQRVFLITALIVPAVDQKLILGLNFWHDTGFIPDIANGTWSLSNNTLRNEKLGALKGEKGEDGDKLCDADRQRLLEFVDEIRQSFPPGLGRTNVMEHVIDTGDARPIKCKQRYIPPPQLELLQQKVDELLELNVIEESISPWCSPVFMHKEEGKEPRFVADMRQVNAKTIPDAYGIENMNAILDNLGDFKFISTIDFKKSYWQVGLSKESRPKTAFYVPGRGQFQFQVVPFGAINSGPGWMRVIDRVTKGSWIRKYVKWYIDDGIAGTPTLELHFAVLKELFRLLLEANLTPNWDKCKFLRTSIKILGYVLDDKGLHPNPEKVSDILQLERPKNPTHVRKFLGELHTTVASLKISVP
jgi:Reverse transcriptase (RNA-dependent DNA polymerase)